MSKAPGRIGSTPSDPEAASGRRTTRSRLFLLLKITVSAVLLVVLVSRAGLSRMGSTFAHSAPGWLAAGLAVGVLAAMLQANQWRGLLAALALRRSYLSCLRLDTAGRFFDAALPTSIGGDVARAALVSRTPDERIPAVLSVVMRRIASMPGLVAVIAAGLIASWHLPYVGRVRLAAAACVLGGSALLLVLALAGHRHGRKPLPLPRPVRKLVAAWIDARGRSVGERRPFARAGLRGLLFWLTVVVSQYCFMRAVAIHTPLEYAAVVVTTVNALSLLPISLGGYGLRESAFSAFLTAGGLATTSQGVAVGICLSAQTLLFGLVGGVVYLTVRASGSRATVRSRSPEPFPVAVRPVPEGS